MAVIETEFTLPPGFGVSIGPSWATRISRAGGGSEQRNQKWSNQLDQLQLIYNARKPDGYEQLLNLFNTVQGRTLGWLFTNPIDNSTAPAGTAVGFDDVTIGTGTGSEPNYQLFKTYTFGAITRQRKIVKPKGSTVRCGINGVEVFQPGDFTVNEATGIVTFSPAPGAGLSVTAGFNFRIPVRFASDRLPFLIIDKSGSNFLTDSDIAIVEVRDEDSAT